MNNKQLALYSEKGIRVFSIDNKDLREVDISEIRTTIMQQEHRKYSEITSDFDDRMNIYNDLLKERKLIYDDIKKFGDKKTFKDNVML